LQAESNRSNPGKGDPPQNGIGTGQTFSGEASWYKGRGDPNDLTAANRWLKFGTLVRVTYGNKSVVVCINDRGPYARDRHGNLRVIDLSRGAASKIGLISAGIGHVTCEVVN